MDPAVYQVQLSSELKRRKIANPSYSLRSFARDLSVSPAHLSKILRGEKNLSLDKAISVAERLGYSENEASQFCQLVQQSNLKTPKLKQVLKREDQSKADDEAFVSLRLEAFQAVSDWYHIAIQELTDCIGATLTPLKVAASLGISEQEAGAALRRLVKLGMLTKKGSVFQKNTKSLSILTDRPNQAMRNFHEQMIEKAKKSIGEQSSDERDISSLTVAISADKMELARTEIRKFRRRMNRLMESSRPTQVYQLNVQLFALSKPTSEKRKGNS